MIDMNVQREFDALSPSEQIDFNNYRFDLPGLPLQGNRFPVRSDRVEQLDAEVGQQLGGSQLPELQPSTLQDKMIEAAARRKIADRDRILVLALNAVQELDPSCSYQEFVPVLEPFKLTDEEIIQVMDLLADKPFSESKTSNSSRVTMDNFTLTLPVDYKKIELFQAFLYRSDTSNLKLSDVVAKACLPVLNNKILISFDKLSISEAQAAVWESKPLKVIADWLSLLYPKDVTNKADTLQRISAWKCDFNVDFEVTNIVEEERRMAQLFDIENLSTAADNLPINQAKFAKALMAKIPKDSRTYIFIMDLPEDKKPVSIKTWIRAVSMARHKGRELIKEAAAWQPTKPSQDASQKGDRKRRHEDELANRKKNRGDSKGNPGGAKDG
jgi:hypothetical protein